MNASELLELVELNKTNSRIDLLNFLIDKKTPLTIDDFKKNLPKYNESTIYRNLDKFIENNIVKKISIKQNMSHFEYCFESHSHHHHHLICRECGEIHCLDICALEKILSPKIKRLGYTNILHHLEFSGICPRCASKKN